LKDRVGVNPRGPLFLVVILSLVLAQGGFGAELTGANGLTVSVDPNGTYDIVAPEQGWHFDGAIGVALSNLSMGSGADQVGGYSEISFDFQSDAPRHAAIRVYNNTPAVLFTAIAGTGAPNTFSFPDWTSYPQNLFLLTYAGSFAPPLFGGSASDSPWILFDSARNTFILSAAQNFMVAATALGPNGDLASGIAPQIAAVPPGFQHQTLLVIEKGINHAFDTWGTALTNLQGKTRPPNDADAILNQVGYWTDRGSSYYYQTEPGLTYEETLSAIKADFDQQGLRLGYMQLDSWFYPKGASATWNDAADGIYQYTAAPSLFPQGLSSFQQSLGVPLVTHARWIDSSSPYRRVYQVSGNVVVDSRYWNSIAGYLGSSGVATYEQDWLDSKAVTSFNLSDGDAFLGKMAAAMAQRNLTMQYCMPLPRHLLQSSRYSNLTTARVSNDRFSRGEWTHFLYTSRLASALGVWPFTDVFMSTEVENLLLATLSAGPVGIGDPIGGLNAANVLMATRQDGVVVKPDVPLTPVDSSYLNTAQGVDAPQIDATYSDFGGLRTYYVVAYADGANTNANFTPADLGIDQPVYLYDYFAGAGKVVQPSESVSAPILNSLLYLIAAPIGPSGMAVIGDTGQFVSMGKKRVTHISNKGAVHLTVAFANGEASRTIQGYSPVRPIAWADTGSIGGLSYNPDSHQFQVVILPDSSGTASIGIGHPHHRRGN
jgi:hypothetical protein